MCVRPVGAAKGRAPGRVGPQRRTHTHTRARTHTHTLSHPNALTLLELSQATLPRIRPAFDQHLAGIALRALEGELRRADGPEQREGEGGGLRVGVEDGADADEGKHGVAEAPHLDTGRVAHACERNQAAPEERII